MYGKEKWVIPDGFMSNSSIDNYISHEAVCVVNLSKQNAEINITILFEDKPPLKGFTAFCNSERTNHIRLDKLINDKNEKIPFETPYAIYVESNTPIIVQHSRMDVSLPEMTLMTTIAY